MEHRFSGRVNTRTTVELYYRGSRLASVPLKDLSCNGAFVVTGPLTLRAHAKLEIEFRSAVGAVRKRWRVPAMLVRTAPDGLGLMFTVASPRLRRMVCLLRRLHARRSRTTPSTPIDGMAPA